MNNSLISMGIKDGGVCRSSLEASGQGPPDSLIRKPMRREMNPSVHILKNAICRNLLEGSAAEAFSRSEVREPDAVPDAIHWPVAWLMLKPLQDHGRAAQQGEAGLLVIPLRIDVGLPDYLTTKEEFARSMELRWEVGYRFQMFFGGKSKSKSKGKPGDYHKEKPPRKFQQHV